MKVNQKTKQKSQGKRKKTTYHIGNNMLNLKEINRKFLN